MQPAGHTQFYTTLTDATRSESARIIETVLAEEGRPPESIFDFVQGITALARTKTHQDVRLDLETRAKRLLDRVH